MNEGFVIRHPIGPEEEQRWGLTCSRLDRTGVLLEFLGCLLAEGIAIERIDSALCALKDATGERAEDSPVGPISLPKSQGINPGWRKNW